MLSPEELSPEELFKRGWNPAVLSILYSLASGGRHIANLASDGRLLVGGVVGPAGSTQVHAVRLCNVKFYMTALGNVGELHTRNLAQGLRKSGFRVLFYHKHMVLALPDGTTVGDCAALSKTTTLSRSAQSRATRDERKKYAARSVAQYWSELGRLAESQEGSRGSGVRVKTLPCCTVVGRGGALMRLPILHGASHPRRPRKAEPPPTAGHELPANVDDIFNIEEIFGIDASSPDPPPTAGQELPANLDDILNAADLFGPDAFSPPDPKCAFSFASQNRTGLSYESDFAHGPAPFQFEAVFQDDAFDTGFVLPPPLPP
jgi:hypothetical protein